MKQITMLVYIAGGHLGQLRLAHTHPKYNEKNSYEVAPYVGPMSRIHITHEAQLLVRFKQAQVYRFAEAIPEDRLP